MRFLTAGASTPLLAYDPTAGFGSDRLGPGERLILYTDGLVERRREPIDESLRRFAAAAAGAGELDGARRPPPGGAASRRRTVSATTSRSSRCNAPTDHALDSLSLRPRSWRLW